jgi:hypothetical protein
VIKRPKELVYYPVKLTFNRKKITVLEIDITHINKKGRSKFSPSEIKNIVLENVHEKILEPSGVQNFGQCECSYFAIKVNHLHKSYQLVFCLCEDRTKSLGIITLYRK